jgi:hypothetical protein
MYPVGLTLIGRIQSRCMKLRTGWMLTHVLLSSSTRGWAGIHTVFQRKVYSYIQEVVACASGNGQAWYPVVVCKG